MVNGYCKGRVGENFIEQGDFQLIRSNDCASIRPSQFIGAAQPGTVFEMGIVLRISNSEERRCPRCRYVNSAVGLNGWIEW